MRVCVHSREAVVFKACRKIEKAAANWYRLRAFIILMIGAGNMQIICGSAMEARSTEKGKVVMREACMNDKKSSSGERLAVLFAGTCDMK